MGRPPLPVEDKNMTPQEFRADLHIHSRFSRATSTRLNLPLLAAWAALKGIRVLGTGDFTHPVWRAELRSDLTLDEKSGLYALKEPDRVAEMLPEWADSALLRDEVSKVRFMLQAELSSIYKRGGKTRKVHNLIYMPTLDAADAFSERLGQIGNLNSDGRPILGMDSRDILDLTLNTDAQAFLVPAHIWTPWFSLFGSKSGFDSIEECFGSLSSHIFALETGLSSDPEMNRRLSMLDGLKLISNSDAHSGENLAREANIFSGEISYQGIFDALRQPDGPQLSTHFLGTYEFFPDEGKYHLDGHRACDVVLSPEETRKLGGICPVCGKPLTVGVLYRVQELADREAPQYRQDEQFTSLIPLPEMLGEVMCVGPKSRKVADVYQKLLRRFGSELDILTGTPTEDIATISQPLAEGVKRMRRGEVHRKGGYDGEFGTISAFSPEEQKELKAKKMVSVGGRGSASISLLPDMELPAAKKAEKKAGTGKKQDTRPDAAIAKTAGSPIDDAQDNTLANRSDKAPDIASGHASSQTADGRESSVADKTDASSQTDTAAQPPAAESNEPNRENSRFALSGLNPAQAEAVQYGPGPVLVIAGPGTGKTHTLVSRVLGLIDKGVPAKKILAVTFTRRAAAEMDERLKTALGATAMPRTDTLHALAFEFWIRAQGTPVLLDDDAALRVFTECSVEESAPKRRAAWETINLCRERCEPIPATYQPLYESYTQHKAAWNLADYIDLLEFWLTQARSGLYPVLWSEILVDEVQDLSPLQLNLLQAIVPQNGVGFFGIGDPDQSIYGFRGAHGQVEEFFRTVWPELKSIQLTENYRSGAGILDIAQALYEQSEDKKLLPQSGLPDEIHFFEAGSAESEATWVAGQIRSLLGATSHTLLDAAKKDQQSLLAPGEYTPGDIAILVRSRMFMQPLRRALERAGIPFSQPSVDPFWNEPRIGKILEVVGRMLGISTGMPEQEIKPGSGKARLLECPDRVLTRGPISMAAFWGNSDPFDSQFWQSKAFREFTQAFETHQGWSGLFNWLSLQNELEMVRSKSEQVQLITIHASKGLEFPIVFMPCLEDGILPFAGASFLTGQATQDHMDVNEEKRLLYVGLTRARQGLFLSRASKRHLYGRELRLKPSRFLSRMPQGNVRHSAIVAKTVSKQEQLKLF
ncbi:UvrD-helicase domain-containing protein, partial [Desulfovibrio sp. OttesenSCG-928-C06]|nr:UvrD-helicase domain-containing protein [Desulfovibrio sp. OttesenSCG-928-C06]